MTPALPASITSAPPAAAHSEPVIERAVPGVTPFIDAEKKAILKALHAAGWRISGHGGAAEMLGLKPTTLHAKMKKLGVRRPGSLPADANGVA